MIYKTFKNLLHSDWWPQGQIVLSTKGLSMAKISNENVQQHLQQPVKVISIACIKIWLVLPTCQVRNPMGLVLQVKKAVTIEAPEFFFVTHQQRIEFLMQIATTQVKGQSSFNRLVHLRFVKSIQIQFRVEEPFSNIRILNLRERFPITKMTIILNGNWLVSFAILLRTPDWKAKVASTSQN